MKHQWGGNITALFDSTGEVARKWLDKANGLTILPL